MEVIKVWKIISILLLLFINRSVCSSSCDFENNEKILQLEKENAELRLQITQLKITNRELRLQNEKFLSKEETSKANLTALADDAAYIKDSLNTLHHNFEPFYDYVKRVTKIENKIIGENCAQSAGGKAGVYQIKIPSIEPFPVPCEVDNWMVVLKRIDGSVDFYRSWESYKVGFGNIEGEFFIGLDKLHSLTSYVRHELMIVLVDFNGVEKYANYDNFQIGNESEQYALYVLGSYSGTAGDSLKYHKSMKFSTYDRDNDQNGRNCVVTYKGAWWHKSCCESKLTAMYKNGDYDSKSEGIQWRSFRGDFYSYKSAKMMIRPKTN